MTNDKTFRLKNFFPLIIIFILIIFLSSINQFLMMAPTALLVRFKAFMMDFMAYFFIIFSLFKIYNLNNFAIAYSEYDLIAKRFKFYGYIYPFIELFLGVSYLLRWNLFYINVITILIMSISAIGVGIELSKKRVISCACLGSVFSIPMTYVTLLEDLLMAIMALIMLFL